MLGTGAMACLWAGALRHSGCKVTLVARQTPGQGTGSRQTLTLRSPVLQAVEQNSNWQFDVEVSTANQLRWQNPSIKRLIIATKAYDAEAALASLLPMLSDDACVLSLCNGLGFQSGLCRQLQQHSPNCQLLLGLSSDGALLHSALNVQHTGVGITHWGLYQDDPNACAAVNPHTAINHPMIPESLLLSVQHSDNIYQRLWNKLLVNCVINPLTVKHQINNGALLAATYQQELQALCNELVEIYNIAVVKTPSPSALQAKSADQLLNEVLQVASHTAANTSSMLKDARLGRELELGYLNASLVALAAVHQLPCPINQQLLEQLNPGVD